MVSHRSASWHWLKHLVLNLYARAHIKRLGKLYLWMVMVTR